MSGTLSYRFSDNGTTYRATITVPKGMTVRFREQTLQFGTHEVAFDYK